MDPITDSPHWILRIIGAIVISIVVFAITYFALTFSDLSQGFILAISMFLSIYVGAFGWKGIGLIVKIFLRGSWYW